MRFEIFQDVDNKWRWNARYRNVRRAIIRFVEEATNAIDLEIVVVKRRRK